MVCLLTLNYSALISNFQQHFIIAKHLINT